MEYENKNQAAVERQPDFGEIFSKLRQEVNRSIDIANGINYLGNNLKPMLESKEKNESQVKEDIGIIGMLWTEIYKLRDANNKGELTLNHIREIIGN